MVVRYSSHNPLISNRYHYIITHIHYDPNMSFLVFICGSKYYSTPPSSEGKIVPCKKGVFGGDRLTVAAEIVDIVSRAGDIILSKIDSGFSIQHKGAIDLVTDADKASEEFITNELGKRFPHVAILGEEQGLTGSKDAESMWIIDPLDGTTNFAHGNPHFCISVALAKAGQPVLGVVYDPAAKEMFTALAGGGAYLNGKPIKVSSIQKLQHSLFVTGFPYDAATRKANVAVFGRIMQASQGVRVMGSAALDLCYVACGRVEAYWERAINAWDIAAGSLMVAEAGGRVSSYGGDELNLFEGEVLATNGLVHGQLMTMLDG